MKSEVLNVVAHDLQTPISSVINFTYLLKQSSSLSEKQLQMLSHIEYVANAVLRQTVNLLNAASEKISDDMRWEKINLSNLLKSVAEQSNALRKNQTIELRVEPSAIVMGDEEKLREVFENLISNAVKYSPRGTRIEVRCTIDDSNRDVSESGIVRITVKDEGQGLTEGDKEKLFGKFQRLSAKPTAGENSTGLGLYIKRKEKGKQKEERQRQKEKALSQYRVKCNSGKAIRINRLFCPRESLTDHYGLRIKCGFASRNPFQSLAFREGGGGTACVCRNASASAIASASKASARTFAS